MNGANFMEKKCLCILTSCDTETIVKADIDPNPFKTFSYRSTFYFLLMVVPVCNLHYEHIRNTATLNAKYDICIPKQWTVAFYSVIF